MPSARPTNKLTLSVPSVPAQTHVSTQSRSLSPSKHKRGRLPQSQHIKLKRSPFGTTHHLQQLEPHASSTPLTQHPRRSMSPSKHTNFTALSYRIKNVTLSTPEAKILNYVPSSPKSSSNSIPASPASLVESVVDESSYAVSPSHYSKSTPKSPLANLRQKIKEGNQLFKDARYSEAIEIWMGALQHVPHHKGLLHNVALAWDHLQQKDKAVLWLRKSAELGNKASMMVLGMALMRDLDSEGSQSARSQTPSIPNSSRSTQNEEDSVMADEEDQHDEAIKWFQRVYKECGGQLSASDLSAWKRDGEESSTVGTKPRALSDRSKEVHYWFQKAKKKFDAVLMRESHGGEYHYHEHPELGHESILFSPASPTKFPKNVPRHFSLTSDKNAQQTPLNSTISSFTGFGFVNDEDDGTVDEDVEEQLKGTNLMDKLNSSEVSTTTY